MVLLRATIPGGIFAVPPFALGVVGAQVAVTAKHGVAPATSPLSYLQLNPTQGPCLYWYCAWIVWAQCSSWSMRKTPTTPGLMMGMPATCGAKKRAAMLDITTKADKPW